MNSWVLAAVCVLWVGASASAYPATNTKNGQAPGVRHKDSAAIDGRASRNLRGVTLVADLNCREKAL
jgi:hypothetical protein